MDKVTGKGWDAIKNMTIPKAGQRVTVSVQVRIPRAAGFE